MKILATQKTRSFWFVLTVFIIPLFLFPGRVLAVKFSHPVNVSNNADQLDTISSIAVDKNNKVHIAWNGFYAQVGAPDGVAADVFYTTNKNGSFCSPIKITVPTGWYSRDPAIAVDSQGYVHLAFRRSEDQSNVLSTDDIYYVTNKDGDFNNPFLLVDGLFAASNPGEVSIPMSPKILCDNQDHVHVTFEVWYIVDAAGVDIFDCLVYMNNITDTWSAPELAVDADFLIAHSSCLDKDGHVHIAYEDYVVYYTNNTSGAFSLPVLASSSGHEDAGEPDIAVDSQGKAHIVYRAPFLTDEPALYYVNNISGNFDTWIPLSPEFGVFSMPKVAIDDSDHVNIVYKSNWAYDGLLYYGNNINGGFEFTTYGEMSDDWVANRELKYFVLGKNGTFHLTYFEWVGDVYDSDTEIYYLNGSWLDLDDFVGTWDGQGVYFRDTLTSQWIRLTSPVDSLSAGDTDADGSADLIGVWTSGLWVKYSKTKTWAKLSANVPLDIASGDMNGDGRDDVIGSWTSGVWYRNSKTGSWVLLSSSPASRVAAGDINNDGTDDLIGVWTSGLWVKYSVSGSWVKLGATLPQDIACGNMSGDGRDDVLGTWSSGVWYRNSATGAWILMSSSSATRVAAGAVDADAADDLIGVWPTGVWVKNSSDSSWKKISLTLPRDIDAGLFSAGWSSGSTDDSGPLGGFAEGPEGAMSPLDYSSEGPGGWRFAYQVEENLIPQEKAETMTRIPGPGDPGFEWTEQENLFPQESQKREGKKEKRR